MAPCLVSENHLWLPQPPGVWTPGTLIVLIVSEHPHLWPPPFAHGSCPSLLWDSSRTLLSALNAAGLCCWLQCLVCCFVFPHGAAQLLLVPSTGVYGLIHPARLSFRLSCKKFEAWSVNCKLNWILLYCCCSWTGIATLLWTNQTPGKCGPRCQHFFPCNYQASMKNCKSSLA